MLLSVGLLSKPKIWLLKNSSDFFFQKDFIKAERIISMHQEPVVSTISTSLFTRLPAVIPAKHVI
jgi:hypothetical protein